MATLKSNGWWIKHARIAPGPKGRVACLARTGEEADRQAALLEEEARAAATGSPLRPQFPEATFGQFIYGPFVKHVYTPDTPKTTKRKYDSIITQHILPARLPGRNQVLAYMPIAEFGFHEMTDWANGLTRKDGKPGPLSKKQKHSIMSLMREILNLHVSLETAVGRAARVDWKLVKLPQVSKKKHREEPPADFTMEFLKACSEHLPWMIGPAFAALFLGLRRGEICGLTWKAIDREKMKIVVSEQLQPETKGQLVETKSESRSIYITEGLLQQLDDLGDHNSEFVFTMPRPGRGRRRKDYVAPRGHILPDSISKKTPLLRSLAGLPPGDFHDLRSYAASNLANLGIDPYVIMEILGHSKLDTTWLYINAQNEIKRKALEKLLTTLTRQAKTDPPDSTQKAG